jgi:hypothetical protein
MTNEPTALMVRLAHQEDNKKRAILSLSKDEAIGASRRG